MCVTCSDLPIDRDRNGSSLLPSSLRDNEVRVGALTMLVTANSVSGLHVLLFQPALVTPLPVVRNRGPAQVANHITVCHVRPYHALTLAHFVLEHRSSLEKFTPSPDVGATASVAVIIDVPRS